MSFTLDFYSLWDNRLFMSEKIEQQSLTRFSDTSCSVKSCKPSGVYPQRAHTRPPSYALPENLWVTQVWQHMLQRNFSLRKMVSPVVLGMIGLYSKAGRRSIIH